MISEYLVSIKGMEMVGVISLILCFASFVFIVIRAIRADRRYVDAMSRLPLDDHQSATPEKVQQ